MMTYGCPASFGESTAASFPIGGHPSNGAKHNVHRFVSVSKHDGS